MTLIDFDVYQNSISNDTSSIIERFDVEEKVGPLEKPEIGSRRGPDVFKDCTAVSRMQQPRQGQCIRPGTARSLVFAVVGPPAAEP